MEKTAMSKLRFLFVLFSLVVLAAPAGAQRKDRGRDGEKTRGGILGSDRRRDEGDRDGERDSRKAHDDDEDDDERGSVLGSRRGHDGDDSDDENDDEGDDDADDDEGGSRISRAGCTVNNGCDVIGRTLPSTLPEMINAVLVSRGQLTQSGRSWLGAGNFAPRFTRSGTGAPARVTWVDRKRNVSQQWLDTNRDGRADVVRFYRAGRLIRTVRR